MKTSYTARVPISEQSANSIANDAAIAGPYQRRQHKRLTLNNVLAIRMTDIREAISPLVIR
jgi:hypothetical protein